MRIPDKISKKIKTPFAFTLVETLLALLILLMVTSIVAAGIPAARNAYEKVVKTSNAEALLSTTISALRNEIGNSKQVNLLKNNNEVETIITFYNGALDATSMICRNTDLPETESAVPVGGIYLPKKIADNEPGDVIMYQRYAATTLSKGGNVSRLISKEASTADLFPTYDSIEFSDGVVKFKGLVVKNNDREFTDKRDVSIRVISYQTKS